MLFVIPEKQQTVRDCPPERVHVPFRFESSGSQIIFFDPEEDFSAVEEDRAKRRIREFRELEETAATDLSPFAIPYPGPRVDQPELERTSHGKR